MTANYSLVYGPPHNIHIYLKAQINTDSHVFACLSASLLPSWSHCPGAPRKQIMFWFDASLGASTIPDMWSVQFSRSVLSNSLQPDGLQHTRLPCPSPTFRVYSNSCPLSQWCHPTISSCRLLFILLSIFPSIRVFSSESVLCIRWPKYWSFSFSISPSNEYPGLISLGWTGWVSLQSKGLSRVFSNTTVQKHHFFSAQLSLLSHPYMTTGKTIALTRWTFVGKVMSLLFNISLGWSQLFFPGASVF